MRSLASTARFGLVSCHISASPSSHQPPPPLPVSLAWALGEALPLPLPCLSVARGVGHPAPHQPLLHLRQAKQGQGQGGSGTSMGETSGNTNEHGALGALRWHVGGAVGILFFTAPHSVLCRRAWGWAAACLQGCRTGYATASKTDRRHERPWRPLPRPQTRRPHRKALQAVGCGVRRAARPLKDVQQDEALGHLRQVVVRVPVRVRVRAGGETGGCARHTCMCGTAKGMN